MRFAWTFASTMIAGVLSACGSDGTDPPPPGEPPVASILMRPSVDTIVVGGGEVFIGTALDSQGQEIQGEEPSWITSDASVATLTSASSGEVHGAGPGTASIEAAVGDKTGTASVTVLLLQYSALMVGYDHACGRTADDHWFCWGHEGPVRQMLRAPTPNFTTGYLSEPRSMQAALAFDTLVASGGKGGTIDRGPVVVCGLIEDGAAYCWGQDDTGAVGDGPSSTGGLCYISSGGPDGSDVEFPCAPHPQPVAGGLRFRAVSSGGLVSCGVTLGSMAYCWGANQYGQLGSAGTGERCQMIDNYEFPSTTEVPCSTGPSAVAGGHAFTQVAAGQGSVCALTAEGKAYCWGDNSLGQLGNTTTVSSSVPVPVAGGLIFRSIAVSATAACGIASDARAYCWGGDYFGQLGDGPGSDVCVIEYPSGPTKTPCRVAPSPVVGDLHFSMLSVGGSHTCGVTTSGIGYCWGEMSTGRLGTDNAPCETMNGCVAPIAVPGGLSFSSIQVGNEHTCGFTTDRVVYCWGDGYRGQLGGDAIGESPVPLKLVGQP